ncbi:MAG: class I SAM-dependent methyltransferase [Spirochaetes bacterium]|nr:class I SAM-dependent methyltransferase [Spirochaetota bacterium]
MKNDGPFCPACKSLKNSTIYKDHLHLIKCLDCGVIFNNTHQALDYNDTYFTTQYCAQYGKTYAEDFDNIYRNSLRRLDTIFKLLKSRIDPAALRMIDIGSAMGFFLKAAKDKGLEHVSGIEVSKFASDYCKSKFHINVINAPFDEAGLKGMYDIITAWYFIEHCSDPAAVVKKIFDSLQTGGIFAFSVPSCFGPLYIFNRDEWAGTHPEDHRIDFSPLTVRRFLKKTGFSRISVYPGGIHPERLIPGGFFLSKPVKILYTGISRCLSFSDTMEIFAVK